MQSETPVKTSSPPAKRSVLPGSRSTPEKNSWSTFKPACTGSRSAKQSAQRIRTAQRPKPSLSIAKSRQSSPSSKTMIAGRQAGPLQLPSPSHAFVSRLDNVLFTNDLTLPVVTAPSRPCAPGPIRHSTFGTSSAGSTAVSSVPLLQWPSICRTDESIPWLSCCCVSSVLRRANAVFHMFARRYQRRLS